LRTINDQAELTQREHALTALLRSASNREGLNVKKLRLLALASSLPASPPLDAMSIG
jgi:hypothetical protein